MSTKEDRGLYIYTSILQDVLADDSISAEELKLLGVAEAVLEISDADRGRAYDHLKGDAEVEWSVDWDFTFGDPDYRESDLELFENLVLACLADSRASEDEWFIMGQLYLLFQITADEMEAMYDRLKAGNLPAELVDRFGGSLQSYLDRA